MTTHGKNTTATWNGQSLGEVSSFGDVNMKTDTIDASVYNEPDGFKKYLLGLSDTDEIPIVCNFDHTDTGQLAYATDYYSKTERSLVITLPGSIGVWTIPCLPTGLGTAQPRDDKISITLTVKPNGKATLATAASTGLTTPFFTVSGAGTAIVPGASGSVYDYVVNIATAITNVTITPTATAGVITVNGNVVATGVPSSAITLGAAGSVTVVPIVVTETGKTPKTYTARLTRAAS